MKLNPTYQTRVERTKQQAAPHPTPDTRHPIPVCVEDLVVRDIHRQIIPLRWNHVQQTYLDLLCPRWQQGDYTIRGLRECVLKARKEGLSTLIDALCFLDTVNTPNTRTVVIADVGDNTEAIFEIVQLFYDHLPADKRPVTRYANRGEYFWPEINSRFYIGTAGAKNFGRGSTLNNLHCSETAFWKYPEDIMIGLLQACTPDSNIFIETTANGVGNYFHQLYQDARSGRSPFSARFFPWHLYPDYALDPPADFEPTEEEVQLAAAYSLTSAQLYWRRLKRREPGLRSMFVQEYPAHPDEAFLASGHPYFDAELLRRLAEIMQSEEYDPLPGVVLPPKSPLLRQAYARGELLLWEMPQDFDSYIVSADTAQGLTHNASADFCSADVLNVRTWKQVAHLYGKWEPHTFGLLLAELGWYYQQALLAIENNNHGWAVIDAALHSAGYPPQRGNGGSGLYYHDPTLLTGNRQSTLVNQQSRQAGWPTNVRTKAFSDDKLAEAILSDPGLWINCRETVSEMQTYLHLPGGGAGAAPGAHDDRVRSLAIGVALLNMRFERCYKPTTKLEPAEPVIRYGFPRRRPRLF